FRNCGLLVLGTFAVSATGRAAEITVHNQPAQLEIRAAGAHSIRVTLKPLSYQREFPVNPVLAEREYDAPAIHIHEISERIKAKVGSLNVEVLPHPLSIVVMSADGRPIQHVIFEENGNLSFQLGGQQ